MRHQGLPLGTFVMGLIVFLAGVCSMDLAPAYAKAVEDSEVIKTDEFEGIIITQDKARDFMKSFSNIEEKDAWTPLKDDVLKLEGKIESYLKQAAAKKSPKLWSKIAPYKRQYVGLVRNNRRVIFVNFFCQAYDINWKTTAVAVQDGGDCFFTVFYDLGRAAFSNLQINGEA